MDAKPDYSDILEAIRNGEKKHRKRFLVSKGDAFFRAIRQMMVNIQAIEKIENYFGGKLKVRLNPPVEGEVVVSRLKAGDFKEWLDR